MPLALEEAPELVYFLVVIIIGEKYSVFGYAGSMSFTDLAYLIMCASGGHIVAYQERRRTVCSSELQLLALAYEQLVIAYLHVQLNEK